jgi:hypothetical protein
MSPVFLSTQQASLKSNTFPKKRLKTQIILDINGEMNFTGPLTKEQRQQKIEKYKSKKKNRIWKKKISYDCRKRVADRRIRVKGRFITKEEANKLIIEVMGHNNNEDNNGVKPLQQVREINTNINSLINTQKLNKAKQTEDKSRPTHSETILITSTPNIPHHSPSSNNTTQINTNATPTNNTTVTLFQTNTNI